MLCAVLARKVDCGFVLHLLHLLLLLLFIKMNRRPRRHFSYVRECCVRGNCYNNFTHLDNRIANSTFKPMFEYMYESSDGQLIRGCPDTLLWAEFLFDYWDWHARLDFENKYTTLLEVNRNGQDKIFVNWRVSDKYKGWYGGIGLTRNMVDIRIYIPTRNLFCEHHFCFRYFNRYLGTPENCVINKLKVGIGLLYDRYFEDISPDAVRSRQSNVHVEQV